MRKAFISPTKYVQGEDELLHLGYFVKTFGDTALLVATEEDIERVQEKLDKTAEKFGVKFVNANFGGDNTKQEAEKLQKKAAEEKCACTVGLGGGKAIDASKSAADGEALIIVPTVAASDAPTSHSAVLYTKDGKFDDYAYFKQSPSVVLLDTSVIAAAPVQFLVSGMGDALATYFEARACKQAYANVNAGLPSGALNGDAPPAKSTNAAYALAELCYETLLEDGLKAKEACEANAVTQALENIVEANILLSGLGFESAGLAAAHAIHDGLTELDAVKGRSHGEKVVIGTLAQLVLENTPSEELYTVLDFCLAVGLPVCLEDIGLADISEEDLLLVAEKACVPEESIHNMPFAVKPDDVVAALRTASRIGSAYKEEYGREE